MGSQSENDKLDQDSKLICSPIKKEKIVIIKSGQISVKEKTSIKTPQLGPKAFSTNNHAMFFFEMINYLIIKRYRPVCT